MPNASLSASGVLVRILAAALLVFATYNPEGYSYWHWALAPLVRGTLAFSPLKFLAGVVLAGGWAVFLRATHRSIGAAGALLMAALFAGVVWLLIDLQLVSARSGRGIAHVVLLALSAILGVGMSWSHMSRRLSGQGDTDVVG